MKTRILSLLLCVLMLVSMVPVSVSAAEADYVINSAQTLKTFRDLVNAGDNFSGKKVMLLADVDLSGETWTPISNFAGEFDGNGKTIKNFHIEAIDNRGGFFNVIASGSGERVHDLTLANVTATVGNNRFGTLANSVQGIVNRVKVKNITVTTTHTGAWVGGMCAFMSWPWMNDCTVENLTVNAEAGADIIAGFSSILQKNSNMVFDNNDVKGFKVTIVDTDSSGCGVGGFVGQTQRGWEYPKITNSDITGIDITASGLVDVGGFIAWPGAHTTLENCTTEGKIDATGVTSSGCFAGGFFGNLGWNADLGQMGHVVTDCSADVDVITKIAPAGGFVGSATNSNNASMYATFTDCTASGDITCVAGGTAPVGGFAGDADRGVYNNCSASGTVTGVTYAGGFIGHIVDVTPKYDSRYPAGTRDYYTDEITLENCDSTSLVTGEAGKTGGLIGYIDPGKVHDDANNTTYVTLTSNTFIVEPMINTEGSDNTNEFGNTQTPLYTVTAAKTGEGTVSGGATVISGESVTLTAVPADGYYFVAWKDVAGTAVSTSATYTFTPTANTTLTAEFALIPEYTIVVEVIGSGTVTGAGTYEEGTEVTLTAAPANGYNFVRWEEDGIELGTELTLDVTVNSIHTITAVFEKPQPAFDYVLFALAARYSQKFDVVVSADNATVNGDMTIKYKRSGTVDIAVADGYKLVDVIANGQSLGAVDSVTFKKVVAPQTLVVVTEALYTNPYTDIAADNAAVQYVTENGIMTAVEESKFAPEAEATRALIANVLYAVAGKPEFEATVTVNDSTDAAILWAASDGILTPDADGLVKADTVITMADLNAALNAYAGTTDVDYIGLDAEAAAVAATRADVANTIYLFCTIPAEW